MSELTKDNKLQPSFENPVVRFVEVNENHPLFPQVEDLFIKIIAPLYGDQTEGLNKIGKAKDRECQLLMEGKEIRGVLVYKKQPNDDFAQVGGYEPLKLKHFLWLMLKIMEVVVLVLNYL